MPASEFKEWLLFEAEEPIGDRRADYHAALIAFSAAKHAGNKQNKFKDFLLFGNIEDDSRSVQQDAAQINDAFLKAASRLKKRVIHRRK